MTHVYDNSYYDMSQEELNTYTNQLAYYYQNRIFIEIDNERLINFEIISILS